MSEIQPDRCLEREDFGDMTVLRVKVPLLRADETTEALFEQTFSLVDGAGRSRLVLNLDGVAFMASAAIGKLILLMRKTASAGGKLTLCKLSRRWRRSCGCAACPTCCSATRMSRKLCKP